MKSKAQIGTITLISFLSTVIIGTLWHFAYQYSSNNTLIGAFAPVNESVWEHLKLIMFPALAVSFVEFLIYGSKTQGFVASKGIAAILGMIFVVASYYTYIGIAGNHFFIADIIIFIFGSAISVLGASFIRENFKNKLNDKITILTMICVTVLTIMFIYFTFNPPMCELFKDPISEDYGAILY